MIKEDLINETRLYTTELQKKYISLLEQVLENVKKKNEKQIYVNIHNDLITAICVHQEGIEHIIMNYEGKKITMPKLVYPPKNKENQNTGDYSKQKIAQGALDDFTKIAKGK